MQLTVPGGHVPGPVHVPATHVAPAMHAFAHIPQWAASERVSTQRPAHRVCPAGHAHAPPLHTRPPVHTVPHAPQLLASVCRLRHVPEQLVCPAGHVMHVSGPPWQKLDPLTWHWSIPANVRHHTQPETPVHDEHVLPLHVGVARHMPETHD
jgi:hypothetical protein